MKRVSINDIARCTGLSKSTVSLVLRGESGPGDETRTRIEAAAKELGYRPNPILASLASKHFKVSARTRGVPVAYIEVRKGSYSLTSDETFVKGVTFARRLGYQLKPFYLGEFKDGVHLSRILHAQGFEGIILSPSRDMKPFEGMKWSLFSVVAIGELYIESVSLDYPRLNRASIDHFRLVLRCWAEVWRRGYRRIGFILYQDQLGGPVDDEMRLAATETCQSRLPRRLRVPPLIIDVTGKQTNRRIEQWALQHRPEAVIGFNSGTIWNLEMAGFRVPADMAFASLHTDLADKVPGGIRISGMQDMTNERIETAIQLLDQQIRHHHYGLDPKARTLMIQSEWIEGDTMPARVAGKSNTR